MAEHDYKIILDTDIGDDIDDAYALAYGLRKNLNFVGITTVFKNTGKRAAIAKKLVSLANANIPVYAGYGDSLARPYEKPSPIYYTDDLDLPEYQPDNTASEEAVDFILDCANKYGKELVVLAIGPLTNIARAINKDQETMSKVAKIVIMGGHFYDHFREWNILMDPEAAKIVFESGIPLETASTDCTYQCKFNEEQTNAIINMTDDKDPMNAYLSLCTKKWCNYPVGLRGPILHDSLALSMLLGQNFVETENIIATVETQGTLTRGMTINLSRFYHNNAKFLKENKPNIVVSKKVNSEAFLADQFKVIFNI